MAAEEYRRLARLAAEGPVRLRVDTAAIYADDDPRAYNILADIPGRSRENGYVMAGAHLDSWAAGDGATDNGAGVAVVMEAARILSSLHVRPHRSIRFAFWAGEKQGLFGSRAYVAQHLATLPPEAADNSAPRNATRSARQRIRPLSGHSDLAAYFNIDDGAGRIRGLYAAGNLAALPKLKEWMAPLASIGDRLLCQPSLFLAIRGFRPKFQRRCRKVRNPLVSAT